MRWFLAFEPKDPFRLLELLLMNEGPLQGLVGRKLATALAERTGFGPLWQSAKADIAESIRKRFQAQADADGSIEPLQPARPRPR